MIICDLDGTMFDNHHRANLIPRDKTTAAFWLPFNRACADDKPIMPVIDFVKHMVNGINKKIVFLTSRCEGARQETADQLLEHFGKYDCKLIMRQSDDNRPAEVFKMAMFSQLLSGYRVIDDVTIIDDNKEIIKMAAIRFTGVNCVLVPSFDCTVNLKN